MNAVTCTAFDMQEHLIAYSDDLLAARAPQSLEALSDEKIQCVLGVAEMSDDESVHADYWECHPSGDETLYVLEGRLLVIVDHDATVESVIVGKSQAFIVPRGRWHRLRVLEPGRILFFTPAVGTTLRPRAHREGSSEDSRIA